jgi:hypothetical protein
MRRPFRDSQFVSQQCLADRIGGSFWDVRHGSSGRYDDL